MTKWLAGSVKRRVLVLFLSIVLIITLVVIGVTGLLSRGLVYDLVEQNAFALVHSHAQLIEVWKEERMHELQQLANSSILETGDWEQIEPYLQRQIGDSPDYYQIFFVATPDGEYDTTLQRNAGNLLDRSYFSPVMAGETIVSEPLISRSTGEKIIVVATPIWDPGQDQVIALLGLSVALEKVYQGIIELDIGYPDSDVFIIGEDGTFLTHSDPEMIMTGTLQDYYPEWEQISQQENGSFTYLYNGIEYRAFFTKFSPQWHIVMQVPTVYYKKPVQRLLYLLLVIGLLCVIVVFRIGKWFADATTQPVIELKEIFQRGSQGDLTVRAEVATTDEFGETRAYFNKMMETIGTMTYYDPVTKLPNRQYFLHHLQTSLNENPLVILVLVSIRDLAEYKTLLGTKVIDGALVQVAERLQSLTTDELIVARVADAEFGVIIPSTTSGVLRTVDNLDKVLSEPLTLNDRDLRIRLFGGITISEPEQAADAESIYRQAQTALYEAEHSLNEQLKLYNPSTHQYLINRVRFQAEIREALEAKQFTVFYQPILNFTTRKIVGKEALIRWEHPERGLLSPGEFLQAAEQGGFIEEIGEYVLSKVYEQHKTWHKQGLDLGWVAVNISANHFQTPNFPTLVRSVLEDWATEYGLLKIEVTEDAMLSPSSQVLYNLEQLQRLGVAIAIDDFGTAYSTLDYLIKYPMETLKIDKTFISSLDSDPRTQGLVSSIITMGRNLSMNIIAEGVERRTQVELLHRMGCNEMQGYFFSHPVPWQEYPDLALELSKRIGRNGFLGD